MKQRRLTKRRRLLATAVRLYSEDRELMYLAADREGVSQSEFLRAAIRAHATRVLADNGGKASRSDSAVSA